MAVIAWTDRQGAALTSVTSSAAGTFALKVTQHSLIAGKALHAQQRRLWRGMRSDIRRRLALWSFCCGLFPALHLLVAFILISAPAIHFRRTTIHPRSFYWPNLTAN